MLASNLDRLIQFQRGTTHDDGFTETKRMKPHGNPVWAAREDFSDGERLRAGGVQTKTMARFVVWRSDFTAGLKRSDSLISGEDEFNIVAIKPAKAAPAEMIEITAVARVD